MFFIESSSILLNDASLSHIALGFSPPISFHPDTFLNHGPTSPRINLSLPISGSLKNYLPFSEYRSSIYYWIPFNIALPTLTILVHVGPAYELLTGASFAPIIDDYPQVSTMRTIIYIISGDFSDQFNFTRNPYLRTFGVNETAYPLEIPASAFQGIVRLVSVSIPTAVSVGASAFSGCSSLTTVELDNVEILYQFAFKNCTPLSVLSLAKVTTFIPSTLNGLLFHLFKPAGS
jgi:hypothetical protein